MRRRDVLAALAGMTVASPSARAQPAMPVIGFLSSTSPEAYASRVAAYQRGLSEAGYAEGQT